MLFDEALQYLLSLGHETLAIKLGLKNIERLLLALDSPQSSFPSVQIAGTNGKGSVAVMLESVVRAAGIRSGIYTSPHLARITERIKINGLEISRDDFARHATRVRDAAEALCRLGTLETPPTFFEQVTAIALLAFKEADVQLAILETGLGGRLDATTVAGARVVAITQVAIDHQEYLGETLSEIAAEKAAIIRPGVEAVIAPQLPEALEVIERRCRETGVTPHYAGKSIAVKGASAWGNFSASFETDEDGYGAVRLGLRGRHQVVNASVAICLAERLRSLGFHLTRTAIIEGIESARHAGRLELWEGSPSVLFDGAHNVASALALSDYLREFTKAPVTLVFGAMRDKQLNEMAALVFPKAEHLILTEMNNPRAAKIEALMQLVPRGFPSDRITRAHSPLEAAQAATKITPPEGLIVVTGSLYLVGEMRELLSKDAA
ncbi:MAG: bifunctional folylpolyglutamate synthase/dihydrofolate synthase [Pyrinomonadaceae bacterium]|nr:bifunctional folylpolyglutamate synthase/dihydrofolate synthase [Pyrinomonadaceae bacterium]